jgi:hypothetical protein
MTRNDIKDWKSIKRFFYPGSNQRTALIMGSFILSLYLMMILTMILNGRKPL